MKNNPSKDKGRGEPPNMSVSWGRGASEYRPGLFTKQYFVEHEEGCCADIYYSLSREIERLNKEIKRRTKVVGVFPDQPAVIRLVGTLLIEIDDDWRATQRSYFSKDSMQLLIDFKSFHKKEKPSFLFDLATTVCQEA